MKNGHFAVTFRRLVKVVGNLQRSHHFWSNLNAGFVGNRKRDPVFTFQQTTFSLSFSSTKINKKTAQYWTSFCTNNWERKFGRLFIYLIIKSDSDLKTNMYKCNSRKFGKLALNFERVQLILINFEKEKIVEVDMSKKSCDCWEIKSDWTKGSIMQAKYNLSKWIRYRTFC